MPIHTADRVAALSESQTLAMAKRIRALKAAGRDILSLTLGEPDFETPAHIKEAAIEAIREGFTHYPPVAGIPELKAAIADKFARDNDLFFRPEQIVVSTGAKQSLVNAIMALVNPGDEVLIPAPYWVSYVPMVQLAEGVPVVVPPDPATLKPDPARLEAAITPRTRLLILNSPSNPSGLMYNEADLQAIADVLVPHPQIAVLSDEIYEYITYGSPHLSIGRFPEVANRTVTVNGMSKAFAMTGWRLGYLGAPPAIAAACEKVQGQITSGACSITQRAALAALTGDLTPTRQMVQAFHQRRDAGIAALRKHLPDWHTKLPDGAFYFYPKVSASFGRQTPQGKTLQNATDITEYLLAEAGVGTVDGTAFGSPDYIRLSYACDLQTFEQAILRMAEALGKLA